VVARHAVGRSTRITLQRDDHRKMRSFQVLGNVGRGTDPNNADGAPAADTHFSKEGGRRIVLPHIKWVEGKRQFRHRCCGCAIREQRNTANCSLRVGMRSPIVSTPSRSGSGTPAEVCLGRGRDKGPPRGLDSAAFIGVSRPTHTDTGKKKNESGHWSTGRPS